MMMMVGRWDNIDGLEAALEVAGCLLWSVVDGFTS
jgi:hypothetical protein